MTTKEIFKFLRDEIHTTVFATTDSDGLPVTCVIDIMLAKEERLYFITAKGKSFYDRLVNRGYVALSGLKGEDTMSSVSVSIKGHVRDIGDGLMDEVFEKNDYMNRIYPTVVSRKALTVFEVYKGSGEYFDLSKQAIERYSFVFGGEEQKLGQTYSINTNCTGCGACLNVCPTSCIDEGVPFSIQGEHCLHCGNCFDVCTFMAIDR